MVRALARRRARARRSFSPPQPARHAYSEAAAAAPSPALRTSASAAAAAASRAAAAAAPRMAAGDNSVLLIQNKGGGHGELGYHLSQQLADKYGLKVTMLHDGGPDAKVRACVCASVVFGRGAR